VKIELQVEKAQAGDQKAFRIVYNHLRPSVYSLCLHRVENETLAEELTQDVFVKLWKKLSLYTGQTMLRTWVWQMAINEIKDHFRKQGRNSKPELVAFDDADCAVDDRTELSIDLERAIGELPARLKAVFLLREVERCGYGEICQQLGLCRNVARYRLNEAKLMLRNILSDNGTRRECMRHKKTKPEVEESTTSVPNTI